MLKLNLLSINIKILKIVLRKLKIDPIRITNQHNPNYMKHLFILTLLLISSLNAVSAPAFPGIINKIQPNGEIIQLKLIGDEHYSMFTTPDGYPVILSSDNFFYYAQESNGIFTASTHRIETERSSDVDNFLKHVDKGSPLQKVKSQRSKSQYFSTKIQKAGSFPSEGTAKGLVLLVEYSDVKFDPNHTNAVFDKQINQANYSENGCTGSVRDYFVDQSHGVFEPSFDVVGPITLPNPMSYYGRNGNDGNDVAPANMVLDACEIANKSYNINFKDYDNSNSGYVDLIYVIYAGYAEAQGGPSTSIWPHAWDVRAIKNIQLDGVTLASYACSSELSGNRGSNLDGIGTVAHEFSHCLGLPDTYDVNYSGNFGMGSWDIMCGGSYNNGSKTPAGYSAYEKASIGWIDITELKHSGEITLQSIESSKDAYSITNPSNPNEQYIFENRQPVKWDKYLPSRGLMITHIDYDERAWAYNQVNTGIDQRWTIVPADNVQSNYSQIDDLYPNSQGNNAFYSKSTPSTEFYDRTFPNVSFTDIQLKGNLITFDFTNLTPTPPTNIQCEESDDNSLTLQWDVVENATEYEVRYQETYLSTTIFNEDFSKMSAGSYDSPNTINIGSRLNNYLNNSGFRGANIYQAGGACRIGTNSKSGYLRSHIIPGKNHNNSSTISFSYKSFNKTNSPGKVVVSYDDFGLDIYSSTELPNNSSNIEIEYSDILTPSDNRDYYITIISTTDLTIDNLRLEYNSEKIPNNSDTWTSTGYTSDNLLTIERLLPNTEYRLQVRSINNNLFSEWSESFNFATKVKSSIEEAEANKTIFHYSENSQLVIYSLIPQSVSIFNMNGQLIKNLQLSSESIYIELPKGVYIIKDNKKIYKIIH